MENRRERLNKLLAKVVKGDKKITGEKHLRDDLGLVSIQMMELIAMVEKEFDIIVPINKVAHVQTVKDLYEAIDHVEEYIKTDA